MRIQSDDAIASATSVPNPITSVRRAWITVTILALLSVVSFVDRQILVLLVEDLKADLAINDLQFGFLVGPVFIITYNIVLIPLSFLVDRVNRKYLLLAGCFAWSTMTLASAFATSYGSLIVFRSGLAMGEALLAPVAMSIIGDLFTTDKRALPTSVFVAGSTIGATSATLFGALAYSVFEGLHVSIPSFGPLHSWRLTLIAVAVPSFLLGMAYWIGGVNPGRGRIDLPALKEGGGLRRHLGDRGLIYLLVCVATGLSLLASTGINIWGPAYLMRHFGLGQAHAGYLLGGVSTVASVLGLLVFPALVGRRAKERDRGVAMAEVTVVSVLIAVPGLFLVGFAPTLTVCLMGAALTLMCVGCASSLPTQVIQVHTPAEMKGRITALVLFFMFLISVGIGPVLVPFIAEHMFSGDAAIGRALAVAGMIACGLAALLLIALRTLLRRNSR